MSQSLSRGRRWFGQGSEWTESECQKGKGGSGARLCMGGGRALHMQLAVHLRSPALVCK